MKDRTPLVSNPNVHFCTYKNCNKPTTDLDNLWCEHHDKEINM